MSIRRRARKAIAWALATVAAVAVGGSIAAYHYATESDLAARVVAQNGPRYLPGCRFRVDRARVRPFAGKVTLDNVTITEPVGDDGAGRANLLSLPKLELRYDPWAMARGRFEPLEVNLFRPTLRLRARADGSWDLRSLLADPWPGPKGGPTPPILVERGVIEIEPESGPPGGPAPAILREVRLAIAARPDPAAPIAFELEARGEMVNRLALAGTLDPRSGRARLARGEVGLNLNADAAGERLPAGVRDLLAQVGLDGGEVEARLVGLAYDPAADPPLHYEAAARLRGGSWRCRRFPFPLADVSAVATVRDGRLRVDRAAGSNGPTAVALRGGADLSGPACGAFWVEAEVDQLELDHRLRDRTPAEFADLWDEYFPMVGEAPSTSAGRVKMAIRASRPAPGAAIEVGADAELLDVSMRYRHFAYPLDHIRGRVRWAPDRLEFADVRAVVGGGRIGMNGTVERPGPDAVARLRFDVVALPIDKVLLDALPEDVRRVVADFRPTGAVGGVVDFVRLPPLAPTDDPVGRVAIDSTLDFDEQANCAIAWKGLNYPVMNLAGQLEIHPDRWIIRRVRGRNGQAQIELGGEVRQVRPGEFGVALDLSVDNLPFDQQLSRALPPKPWAQAWATLNPTGACNLRANIKVDPAEPARRGAAARPAREAYRIAIEPLARTGVNLRFDPLPAPGGPAPKPMEIRMDELSGRFVFDTEQSPPLTMAGVGFTFQRAPVRLARGTADIKESGQFDLKMRGLEVADLRLDQGVRALMPQVMATFARRLDDRRLGKVRADLDLSWSGVPGESARCRWAEGRVVLVDNRILVGTDLALDHIQGEVDQIAGSFDGRALDLRGRLGLESISLLDQQVTGLKGQLGVKDGWAHLEGVEGRLLGGKLEGKVSTSLDVTPNYSVTFAVEDLDLREYAKRIPGQQGFKGFVSGHAAISGMGYDPHAISGEGQIRVARGDLGTLPVALRLFNVLKLAKDAKAAFDSAGVTFVVRNGETILDPVRLTGNAFSLDGRGTLDVRGDLEVKLMVLAGRDEHHVPFVSDLSREISGQLFAVRVFGPIASPKFRPDPLSGTAELFRRGQQPHPRPRAEGPGSAFRSGLEARIARGWLGRAGRGDD